MTALYIIAILILMISSYTLGYCFGFADGYFDLAIVDPEQAQMTIFDLMEE